MDQTNNAEKETMDDAQVDALIASIESPQGDRPLESSEEQVTEETTQQAEPVWNGQEWEFEHNGRKVFPDSREKAMQWLNMGYNYSQRVGEFNNKIKTYEQQIAERDARIKQWEHYNAVDEHVKNNPDWWAHVQEQYKNRAQQQAGNNPDLEKIIESRLNPVLEKLSFVDQLAQEREQEKISNEDRALDTEIESTRKAFATIDFNSVDDSGQTLELRILQHAQKLGLKGEGAFRTAARDYLWEHSQNHAKAAGIQNVAKTNEVMKQKGIIGKTSTPQKQVTKAVNVKQKSWEQLLEEGRRELGHDV